jgi:leucyl-tRNA synthetase
MYILSAAEQTQDADWKREGIESAKTQINRFYNFAKQIIDSGCKIQDISEQKHIDKWIESRIQKYVRDINIAFEGIRTREAIQNAFFLIYNDIKWYHKRGGEQCLTQVVETWTKLMAPFTPHICEEVWSELGHQESISFVPYPVENAELIDLAAEIAEDIIIKTLEDTEEIIRVAKITPKKVYMYTTPKWRTTILKTAAGIVTASDSQISNEIDMKVFMQKCMEDSAIRSRKEAPKYIQKVANDIRGSSIDTVLKYLDANLDEQQILKEAQPFFEKEFGCPVEIFSAEEAEAGTVYDPEKKSRFAEPGRPAIYIEQ